MSGTPITTMFLAPAAFRRPTCVATSLAAPLSAVCAAGRALAPAAPTTSIWANTSLAPTQMAYSALSSSAPRPSRAPTWLPTDGILAAIVGLAGNTPGWAVTRAPPTAKSVPVLTASKPPLAGFTA